jgi:hypothetical protein
VGKNNTIEGIVADSVIAPSIADVVSLRSFMFRLVRLLTAVVLTVHLMVGCCGHHAHACESQGDMQPAHEQCPDSHNGDTDHSQHGPQDCQGAQCSFVASICPAYHSLAQQFQSFVAALSIDQPSLVGSGSEQRRFITDRFLLPVRLDPVNQVLLI